MWIYLSLDLPAQTRWSVQERSDTAKTYQLIYQKDFKDSLAYQAWLKAYKIAKQKNGYLELNTYTQAQTTYLTLGARHTWAYIRSSTLPTKPRKWQNAPFSLSALEEYKQKILTFAENNGHPFAQIRLDSLAMQDNKWRGVWEYAPHLLVRFDTVIIVGKVKVKPRFLNQYLRLGIKQPYNHAKIQAIRTRLQRLPYLRLQKPPDVQFIQDRAMPVLHLTQIKANQFDGIIGVLPNENQRGQVLLTGEANLLFYNIFAQGHSFKLQWQRLQTETQRLELQTGFQTLFNTPLQFHIDFKLWKQDSSFLNRTFEAKLGYTTQGSSDFFAQFLNQKSNLGNASNLYENAQLPAISETRWQGYGIGYKVQTLDDLFFPRAGVLCVFSIHTGNKEIIKNRFLADSLYRGLTLKTPQTLSKIDFQSFWRVGKGVIKAGLQGAYLANNQLFQNELLPIGGLTSIRGHNQNAFLASQYAILTAEYRQPIGGTSYLFMFFDQAYYESRTWNGFQADAPSGVGLGASISLKAGIFSLAYALGKSKENAFALNRAKLHFGIVNRF